MSLPKNLKYHQDGTGRDAYIYSNNGGYYPAIPAITKVDTGKYPAYSQHSKSARHWIRPKKYTINGTGRDSYVNGAESSKNNFLKSLRSTQGCYSLTKTHRPKASLDQLQKQFLTTWRLSQPKAKNEWEDYNSQLSQNYKSRQTTKNFFKTINPENHSRRSFKQ